MVKFPAGVKPCCRRQVRVMTSVGVRSGLYGLGGVGPRDGGQGEVHHAGLARASG